MQYYNTFMKRCPDLSIKLPRNSAYVKKEKKSPLGIHRTQCVFPMCLCMYLSIYYL